jgi:hypothetical protein
MICSLSKWLISGAFDRRRAIPGFLTTHIHRCPVCRDFIQFSETLENRAGIDAQSLFQDTPDSLREKILQQPIQPLVERQRFWERHKLIPIVSVSMAAIFFAVFLIVHPFKVSSPSLGMDSLFMFGRNSLPKGTLLNLASRIESPYEVEWNSLKKNVKSAAEHLRAQFDFKLDLKNR